MNDEAAKQPNSPGPSRARPVETWTFRRFSAAIVVDDRQTVAQFLHRHPDLASHARAESDFLETAIPHWIYAGDTPLHVAAASHRVEIAQLLLSAGGTPMSCDNRRRSLPLHYAADGQPGHPDWDGERQVAMIRLLLGAGSHIDPQDRNGATPLHRAVRSTCSPAVKCLLSAGADPTLRNQSGSTPFHLAVRNTGRSGAASEPSHAARLEIIRAFLAFGLRPTLADARGRTVLQWAMNDEIRRLLATG